MARLISSGVLSAHICLAALPCFAISVSGGRLPVVRSCVLIHQPRRLSPGSGGAAVLSSPSPVGGGSCSFFSTLFSSSLLFSLALRGVTWRFVGFSVVSWRCRCRYARTRSLLSSSRSRFGFSRSQSIKRQPSRYFPCMASRTACTSSACASKATPTSSSDQRLASTVPRGVAALAFSRRLASTASTSTTGLSLRLETSRRRGSFIVPWCHRSQSIFPTLRRSWIVPFVSAHQLRELSIS